MKCSSLHSALFISLLAAASTAWAVDAGDDEEAEERTSSDSVTFSGGGLSKVSSNFDNVADAINIDGTIGFRIPTVNWFSVELNLSQTVQGTDIKSIPQCSTTTQTGTNPVTGQPIFTTTNGDCPGKYTTTDQRQQFGVFSFGVFASLRTPGSFYGLAKIGYRTVNSSLEEHQDQGSGSAYGVGAGYRWSSRSLAGAEVVYNKYGDLFSSISLNFNYGFGGRD